MKDKLEKLILKEEISWRQKARIKWVWEWDNNSKLFHKVVNFRKGNKLINKLEKDNGNVFNCDSVTRCVLVPEFHSAHKLRNSVSNLDNE